MKIVFYKNRNMKKSTKNKELVYLLDDDPVFSHTLELWFEVQGYRIKVFHDAYSFFKGLKYCKPDIVILDYALNENYQGIKTGADVAKRIDEVYSNLPVIMLSAQRNIQVAVDLFKRHIIDYLIKDDDFHINLKHVLKNLREITALRAEIRDLKGRSKIRLKRMYLVVGSIILFWLIYSVGF